MVKECKFCTLWYVKSEEGCRSYDKEGYACTREINHKGNHVACSIVDHKFKQWKNRT